MLPSMHMVAFLVHFLGFTGFVFVGVLDQLPVSGIPYKYMHVFQVSACVVFCVLLYVARRYAKVKVPAQSGTPLFIFTYKHFWYYVLRAVSLSDEDHSELC